MTSTPLNQLSSQFLALLSQLITYVWPSTLKHFLLMASRVPLSFGSPSSSPTASQSPWLILPHRLDLTTQSASGSRKKGKSESHTVSCYRVSKSSYLSLLHLFSLQ